MKFTKTKSEKAELTILHTEGVQGFKGEEGWISSTVEVPGMFDSITLDAVAIEAEPETEDFRTGKFGAESLLGIQKGEASPELLQLAQQKEGAIKAGQQNERGRCRRKDEFDGEVDVTLDLEADEVAGEPVAIEAFGDDAGRPRLVDAVLDSIPRGAAVGGRTGADLARAAKTGL